MCKKVQTVGAKEGLIRDVGGEHRNPKRLHVGLQQSSRPHGSSSESPLPLKKNNVQLFSWGIFRDAGCEGLRLSHTAPHLGLNL